MVDREPPLRPLVRASRAAIVLFGHLCLAAVLLTGIWVLDWFVRFLWSHEAPVLFGRVPLRWLFDAIDVGIVAVFGFWGIWEANQKLKR